MNLIKQIKEIEIDNEDFIMCFDMTSVATYKELTKENFNRGIHKLFKYEDEALLNFMASTIRRKGSPDKPLGSELLEGNILYFLLNHTVDVIEIVANALPDSKSIKKK